MIFSLVFPFGKTFREAPRPQNLLIGAHFLLFTVLSLFGSIFIKVWQKITKERKWYLTSACIHTHMRSVYLSTHPCNTYNQSNKWSSFILQIEHKVQNVNRVTLNLNPLQISWSQCLPTSADFSSTHPIGKSHTGNTIQAAFVTVPWFCAVCHFWIPFLFLVVLWTRYISVFL